MNLDWYWYTSHTVVVVVVLYFMDISTSLSLFPPFCHFTYFCFFLSWVSFCWSISEGWDDVIYICKISPLLLILYSLHWIAITSDFFDQSVVCKFHFEVSLWLKDIPSDTKLQENTIGHAVTLFQILKIIPRRAGEPGKRLSM